MAKLKSTLSAWRTKRRRRRLLQQVMPSEDMSDDTDTPADIRSTKYIERPGFSLPLMTNNFRRFNARWYNFAPSSPAG